MVFVFLKDTNMGEGKKGGWIWEELKGGVGVVMIKIHCMKLSKNLKYRKYISQIYKKKLTKNV